MKQFVTQSCPAPHAIISKVGQFFWKLPSDNTSFSQSLPSEQFCSHVRGSVCKPQPSNMSLHVTNAHLFFTTMFIFICLLCVLWKRQSAGFPHRIVKEDLFAQLHMNPAEWTRTLQEILSVETAGGNFFTELRIHLILREGSANRFEVGKNNKESVKNMDIASTFMFIFLHYLLRKYAVSKPWFRSLRPPFLTPRKL